jgi:hypothetical protein
MWWKASFKDGKYLIAGVRIKNRVDCCGERLTETLVTIGGQECGKLPSITATGKWYSVKCAKPLVGGEIQLTTTKAMYLQISGVKVIGWNIESSGEAKEPSPANTKLKLTGVSQASPYGNNQFPASNAFSGGAKFTHTNKGVGMWWRALFGQNETISKVRIRNRVSCCGSRLARTDVFIGNEKCGQVQSGTSDGKWYTVKCSKPITGDKIELKTTQNTYLSISGIEVWTGESSTTITSTTTESVW